jgi:hypothetical protein
VSYSNNGSNWSVSGSYHLGNSGGFGAGTAWMGPNFGQWLEAQFTFARQHLTLICGGQSSTQYRVTPVAWQGGLKTAVDVSQWDGCDGNGQGYCHQPAGNHADYQEGGTAVRNQNQAHEYGAAIGAFGVTLGGSSKYSTNMQISWRFGTQNVPHDLFGHDGAPATSATTVYSY